jgi:hypothetical protein
LSQRFLSLLHRRIIMSSAIGSSFVRKSVIIQG